jgi:hypothetical protein
MDVCSEIGDLAGTSGCRRSKVDGERIAMFGFSVGDWLFIGIILLVIFFFVWISDMRKKQ